MSDRIVIIGGGIIGLSIAVELTLRGAAVTVLSRSLAESASLASAGMLAPHAEKIPDGALRSLCLRSLAMYRDWVHKLEDLTGEEVGYRPSGILAPMFTDPAGDRPSNPTAIWWHRDALPRHQPGLSPDLAGAWWYPEDGQVDNRSLTKALQAAARQLGVEIREGVTVQHIQQQGQRAIALQTSDGEVQAAHYILATGAWSNHLLPVPVFPQKGQMLAVQLPASQPLTRVLFGEQIYLVPRQDGTLYVGATVEEVGFTPHNTPKGIHTAIAAAIRLYPAVAECPIREFWWGFRPTTPDEAPILGESLCENLTLAVGHHRNGILLAPITAKLIADWVLEQTADPLLPHFCWQRFHQEPSPRDPHVTSMLTHPTPSSSQKDTEQSIQHPQLVPGENGLFDRDADLSSWKDADVLKIGDRTFRSRLLTGTGKYRSLEDMRRSVAVSGCEIVTVAVRRVQTNAPGHEGLVEAIDWSRIWMLPNTAGCKTVDEAIRVARLGREMAKLLGQEDNNFVKLEVIPDAKYLLPDPIGTLQAAEQLVKEGFAVLPYINADPMLAKRLEEVGCVTVMPLGSPIGSGQGIQTAANIRVIIENARVPVVVDAGIGTPSEAAQAMEMGAEAVLINTAIAKAKHPAAMAMAMAMAVEAGRMAHFAGRIPIQTGASPSSPVTGTIG